MNEQSQNFFRRLLSYLLRPQTHLTPPSEPVGVFVRKYLLPMSLLPALSFGLMKMWSVYTTQETGPTLIFIRIVGVIMIGLTNFALAHFWSVIIDGLLAAKNMPSAKSPRGYFVTAYAATPWFITFALFPLIREFCFIGLLWIVVRMPAALEHIAEVPRAQRLKLSAAICCMWLAAFLFMNLVFTGFMSMIAS